MLVLTDGWICLNSRRSLGGSSLVGPPLSLSRSVSLSLSPSLLLHCFTVVSTRALVRTSLDNPCIHDLPDISISPTKLRYVMLQCSTYSACQEDGEEYPCRYWAGARVEVRLLFRPSRSLPFMYCRVYDLRNILSLKVPGFV